jgi:uncharacterized protein YkwD
MKKMRILAAVIVAITLIVGMTITALAAEEKITFPNHEEANKLLRHNPDAWQMIVNDNGTVTLIRKAQNQQPATQTPTPPQPAASGYCPEWIEDERQTLIDLINAERERIGKPALTIDPELMEFAQTRATEGIYAGGTAHTRPDGTRVANELGSTGGNADRAFRGWMNSQGHHDAMLGVGAWDKHKQEHIGVGIDNGNVIMIFSLKK